MGFYLLHESMLGSVLAARDRWLKPGGLLLPHRAVLVAAPFSHSHTLERTRAWWSTQMRAEYGLDFSSAAELAAEEQLDRLRAINGGVKCDAPLPPESLLTQEPRTIAQLGEGCSFLAFMGLFEKYGTNRERVALQTAGRYQWQNFGTWHRPLRAQAGSCRWTAQCTALCFGSIATFLALIALGAKPSAMANNHIRSHPKLCWEQGPAHHRRTGRKRCKGCYFLVFVPTISEKYGIVSRDVTH
eukprot:SAG31_NODE_533_length_14371_cov_6.455367_19_plen_243_part_00